MTDGTRLLLARHGDHDWLHPPIGRLAGRLPGIALNARGRVQAEALGRRLAVRPPHRIVTSPVQRTQETAAIIGTLVGRPVVVDERPIETAMGRWEGRIVDEIIAGEPDAWRAWRTTPASTPVPWLEPFDAVARRMEAAARDHMREGESVLLVSHQDPLLALACRLLDLPLDAVRRIEISQGSLTVFEVTWGRMTLVTLNSVPAEVATPETTSGDGAPTPGLLRSSP
jgi:probable phosphoglycerate mutase